MPFSARPRCGTKSSAAGSPRKGFALGNTRSSGSSPRGRLSIQKRPNGTPTLLTITFCRHWALFYYDQLTSLDVQKWVNAERRKGYRAETIKGWFRVLRTMTRDAMEPLGLPRDPTLRITFPEDEERDDNALSPEDAREVPRQHGAALSAALRIGGGARLHRPALLPRVGAALGGHRRRKAVSSCVVRKNMRGRIGPVSRKKRAPRKYPLHPQLAESSASTGDGSLEAAGPRAPRRLGLPIRDRAPFAGPADCGRRGGHA